MEKPDSNENNLGLPELDGNIQIDPDLRRFFPKLREAQEALASPEKRDIILYGLLKELNDVWSERYPEHEESRVRVSGKLRRSVLGLEDSVGAKNILRGKPSAIDEQSEYYFVADQTMVFCGFGIQMHDEELPNRPVIGLLLEDLDTYDRNEPGDTQFLMGVDDIASFSFESSSLASISERLKWYYPEVFHQINRALETMDDSGSDASITKLIKSLSVRYNGALIPEQNMTWLAGQYLFHSLEFDLHPYTVRIDGVVSGVCCDDEETAIAPKARTRKTYTITGEPCGMLLAPVGGDEYRPELLVAVPEAKRDSDQYNALKVSAESLANLSSTRRTTLPQQLIPDLEVFESPYEVVQYFAQQATEDSSRSLEAQRLLNDVLYDADRNRVMWHVGGCLDRVLVCYYQQLAYRATQGGADDLDLDDIRELAARASAEVAETPWEIKSGECVVVHEAVCVETETTGHCSYERIDPKDNLRGEFVAYSACHVTDENGADSLSLAIKLTCCVVECADQTERVIDADYVYVPLETVHDPFVYLSHDLDLL